MHKISDVFYENIYNIFVEYCKKEGLTYMEDLHDFNFDSLNNVKGIGISKILSIKNKYNHFNGNTDDALERIDLSNYNLSVETLSLFGVSKNIIDLLKEHEIYNISSLILYGNSNLYRLNPNIYKKIRNALVKYEKPILNSVGAILSEYKKEEHYHVIISRANGYTLSNIGKELNITRERVRQIERTKLNKLKIILDIVLDSIVKKYKYKSCINLNKLDEYFEDYDDLALMRYTISVMYKDYYLDFCNKFLINGETKKNVLERLKGITDYYIKDIVNFTKKMVVITESLYKNNIPYIDVEDLTNYLLLNGYIKKGNYVFKSGISYGLICALIIKNHFKNGIKIHDENDLNLLRDIVLEEFEGFELPENNRALSTRISCFLVLCDRGCYTVSSNIKISSSLLNEIYDYIVKYEGSTLFFNDIFVSFKDKLKKYSNVNNRYFLQGVLKYHYDDDFIFERDSLTKKGHTRKNIRELISDFIKSENKPVHRKKIKEKFPGATDVVITNAQISNKSILQWEYNYYIHTDVLKIKEKDIKNIDNELIGIFNMYKGYCSEQLLYDAIMEKFPEILKNNYIKNASNLFYFTQYILKEKYIFRRPHILEQSKNESELSSKTIVERFLFKKDMLKYTDYHKFVSKVKWSIGTAYAVFKDIEKDILRISEDEYILRDKFKIDKEKVDKIFNVINEEIKKNEFVSMSRFGKFNLLPDVGYEWNPFILSSIIQINLPENLRILVPQVEDRRYVKEIVVDKNSEINNYEQLIIHIVKKLNLDGSTLCHLETVLSSKGLIGRYLPKELYNSKNIYIDEDRFYTA